jgi:hypothetical protein
LSSSDGQRFPTDGKIRNAKAIPKYFGYAKGVGIYTHTADQYSQFGSRIVSVHERDATYVLNEILANETDLPIYEHTTDTHGYTDLNFALFDLVGKQFSPRIMVCPVTSEINLERTVNNTQTLGACSEGRRIGSSCVFIDISLADQQIHIFPTPTVSY